MKRVAITTLGCKTNQFESAAMSEALERDGFRIVPFDTAADIYLINSCTVTAKTDAESRRLIRRGLKHNPEARIVVTGCYAQLAADELMNLGVHLVLGNREKRDIASLLRGIGDEPRALVADIMAQEEAEGLPLESFAEHTRAFLQVQNGCNARCSYCIVPLARGKSRSVPPEQALAAAAGFAAKGFREIVLSGIHLGAYGLDLTPRTDLLALLGRMEGTVPRLRLGSLEPAEVTPELVRFLADSPTLCPHLHIPLQSGSDSVLSRMNRGYRRELFREVVESLAGALPNPCIGSDLIAGFPGETDEEFEDGYRFLEALPLAYLHVFPFSPRPGTPAAAMRPQVPSHLVKERARRLRELSERKWVSYQESFLGKELMVLIQQDEVEGRVKGLSRNYLPVLVEGARPPANAEVSLSIVGREGENLVGRLAE